MAHSSEAPNFSQGWGMAAFITLLAVASFLTAGYIKSKTWHSPNDVTAPVAEAEHAPAPAEGAAKH